MDLSKKVEKTCNNMQKESNEKRERQPNWTEDEKQLLLSLTSKHSAILGNKANDALTIKRKSEAWDEIALNMKAAGFNRTKDRLKQQLGRIRSAELKKIKDNAEEKFTITQDANVRIIPNNENQIPQTFKIMPHLIPLQEQSSTIKSETIRFLEHIEKNYEPRLEFPKIISNVEKENIVPTCSNNNQTNVIMEDQIHFNEINNNINAEINNNLVKENLTTDMIPATIATTYTTLTTTTATSSSTSSTSIQQQLQRKDRIRRRIYLNGMHRIPSASNKRLQQIHAIRMTIERNRLRNIQLQQKRDRILYRKDLEIQNLKLQILRNLANQQREVSNGINL